MNSIVPGQYVMRDFKTNPVLNFTLFRAPIDLLDASVMNLLCKTTTRKTKYARKNMGNESNKSIGISLLTGLAEERNWISQRKVKLKNGNGWMEQMNSSRHIEIIRLLSSEMRQSPIPLSRRNIYN